MKLKQPISIIFLVFSIFFGPVHSSNKNESEITDFLVLMNENLPNILNQNLNSNDLFSNVSVLEDGGPSFINSVYLISLKNGEELIIKIGNPIWKEDKTLNEVSALKFLKKNSTIPVPDVLAYESDTNKSPIGKEYIIMPRIIGKPLNKEINKIYENKIVYFKILDQLASHIAQLKKFQFSLLGNFIYSDEELKIKGIVDFANYTINKPCKNYSEYACHALNFYLNEMKLLLNNENQDSWIYKKYIPILTNLLKETDFNILNNSDTLFFCHQDFVMKNILVHEDKITAILDWEWSGSALAENESMTGFDFLRTKEDKLFFSRALEKYGLNNFFDQPPYERQLFYRLIGNVYTLVAFREWKEGKLEHTAKFLTQKLEQRKIRNDPNFDIEEFINNVMKDLDECVAEFKNIEQKKC